MKSNTDPEIIPPEHCFPASADAILALLLCAVDPKIGGVLLVGNEETANEAAVKCLSALLPPLIEKRCYHLGRGGFTGRVGHHSGSRHFLIKPRPLVTLPVDLRGEDINGGDDELDRMPICPDFCTNLLAAADQGVLHVPKINHRDADLREKIFTAFHHRQVHIEWRGKCYFRPSAFLLVASVDSMELGGLSQRELDYFGLCVNGVHPLPENTWRRESQFRSEQMSLFGENPYGLLPAAKKLLPEVQIPDHIQERIATFSRTNEDAAQQKECNTLQKAARALAALNARKIVTGEDLDRTAKLVLPTTFLSKGLPSL
ncbi:MAG: hypothetical protein AB1461_19870 [Thermodesulfobacteriota bacterium]